MSLWVKRIGQLLVAALLLASCEDDSFLLGFKNQNKKFKGLYQEFNVGEGTIVSIDSILTDNLSGTQRLLIGENYDPILGSIKTEAFAEFIPFSTAKLASVTTLSYEYDSLVIQLRLDNYYYGLVNGAEEFTIHRITEDTLTYRKNITVKLKDKNGNDSSAIVSSFGAKRYYTNSTIGYDAAPLETRNIQYYKLFKDNKGKEIRTKTNLSLTKLKDGLDTLVAYTRLADAFGLEIFNVALNDDNSNFSKLDQFRTRFKGLAFIPASSSSVLGFTPAGPYSKITLHYHSTDAGALKDTLMRDFFFNGVSFHTITPNRAAELPAVEPPYSGVSPGSGLRVVQSGNPLITKIDLNPFFTEFADTISANAVLNSAELVIESVSSSDGYSPISLLELRVMKENDRYVDFRIMDDSASMKGYNVFTDGKYYYPNSDFIFARPVVTSLNYSSSKGGYSGFMTLFVQNLLKNKLSVNRLRYLGFYPATEANTGTPTVSVGKSINRSVFNKNNIKLRIYYTLPNTPNL